MKVFGRSLSLAALLLLPTIGAFLTAEQPASAQHAPLGARSTPYVICCGGGEPVDPSSASIAGFAETASDGGYWEVGTDGSVFSFGDAQYYGSMAGVSLNAPVVGLAATPDYKGYWEVGADGGVFTFGDAGFYGSTGGTSMNAQVVALVPTPDGKGYWEVGADGGVFTFGDAPYYGSLPGNGIGTDSVTAAVQYQDGYCMTTSDGTVYCYEPWCNVCQFPTQNTPTPTVGIATTDYHNSGIWIVDRNGQVYSLNGGNFEGGLSSQPNGPITAIAGGPSDSGYTMVGADGTVYPFGDNGYGGEVSVNSELSPANAQGIARLMLPQYNWGTPSQWSNGLDPLWQRESYWWWCEWSGQQPGCVGSGSGGYGIPQADPASQMATAGPNYMTNAWTQMIWGLGYIQGKYADPIAANIKDQNCNPFCGYVVTQTKAKR